MNISRFRQRPFLLRLAGVIVVLATVLGLLLISRPESHNLEKYQALYARGEYEACSSGLSKALERNPDWYEARELHIQVQLDLEDPVAALRNLLYLANKKQESQHQDLVIEKLASSGQDILEEGIALLEGRLDTKQDLDKARIILIQLETAYSNNAPDPENALAHLTKLVQRTGSDRYLEKLVAGVCSDADRYLNILDQMVKDDPDFTWAREMKLQIALEHLDYDRVLPELRQVLEAGAIPKDLSQIWQLALQQGNVPALELALLLNRQDWVKAVLDKVEQSGEEGLAQLPELLKLLPAEPRLLILQAFHVEDPREGLDILLALEASGYIPDPRTYGEKKVALIQRIGRCQADWLAHIPVELIMKQALDWADNRAVALVQWLEENVEDSYGEIDMLRRIIDYQGKKPNVVWSNSLRPVDLAFSPDGEWLLCSDPEKEMLFVHLDTGSQYSVQPWWGPWHWSPDSKRVAAMDSGALVNTLFLYSLQSAEVKIETVELPPASSLAKPEILGWLDNATLLLSSPQGPGTELSIAAAVEAETGEIQWQSEAREGWPMLTTARTLAWVWHDQGDLCLDRGNKIFKFDIQSLMPEVYVGVSPLEWFPGDDRLLVQAPLTSFTANVLYMDSGKIYYVELPFFYRPGNWLDEDCIWGMVSYDNFVLDYNALAKINLETGQRHYAGLLFHAKEVVYDSQGKLVAIGTEQGTTVYRIPGN